MSVINYNTDLNTYVGINSHIMNIIGGRFIYGSWMDDTPVGTANNSSNIYKDGEYFIYDSKIDKIIFTNPDQNSYSTIKKKIDNYIITGVI